MEKDRKFRALAIAAICIAVVGVSVAYAALSTTLTITGTATVDTDASWNISWQSASFTKKDSSITVGASDPVVSGTNITWDATFTAPNTTLELTAVIKNAGTLNAMLQGPTGNSYLTAEGAKAGSFTYKVTINGAEESTKANSILASEGTATVVVTVTLNDMNNDEFEALNNEKVTFMLSLPFIQAADGATTPAI